MDYEKLKEHSRNLDISKVSIDTRLKSTTAGLFYTTGAEREKNKNRIKKICDEIRGENYNIEMCQESKRALDESERLWASTEPWIYVAFYKTNVYGFTFGIELDFLRSTDSTPTNKAILLQERGPHGEEWDVGGVEQIIVNTSIERKYFSDDEELTKFIKQFIDKYVLYKLLGLFETQ